MKFLNPVWRYLTRTVKLRMAHWLAQLTIHPGKLLLWPQHGSCSPAFASSHLQLSPDEGPCPCFSRSRRRRTFPHKSLQQTHWHPESRGLRQSRGISLEPPRGLRPQPRAEALGRVDQMQSVGWDEVGEPTNHEASQGCQ